MLEQLLEIIATIFSEVTLVMRENWNVWYWRMVIYCTEDLVIFKVESNA